MKFHLAINMERIDDSLDMKEVAKHTLEMVQMADQGGFRIAWAAEHHALEMTIAPNPFSILTWWAEHTSDIRLGTAVIAAPYWHPIKAAGDERDGSPGDREPWKAQASSPAVPSNRAVDHERGTRD